uniref:SFRICE_039924 n=1 Tax=Spodoptera frugiperda TaxID=7108 RepID=A0A2H1WWX6_SPOFR
MGRVRERASSPRPSRETLRALGTASKGSSPPDHNQSRTYGTARTSKSHQTTTDGALKPLDGTIEKKTE